jgi:hypothetical protein
MRMAQDGGGSNAWLAFLVGALVVVVAVIAVFTFGGRSSPTKTVDVDVKAPAVSAPAAPGKG